jgi:hypothetical protein
VFSAGGGGKTGLIDEVACCSPFNKRGIMAIFCAYENDSERKQHSRAIKRLAEDLDIPEEEIQVLYEKTLCSLKEGARVKDFLAILVCRNVKAMIKGRLPEKRRERRIYADSLSGKP